MHQTQTEPFKKLIPGTPIERTTERVRGSTNIEYIGSSEAARMLGVSKPTLIKEALEGHINAHLRRGRYLFTSADIQEYILNNMTSKTAAVRKLTL